MFRNVDRMNYLIGCGPRIGDHGGIAHADGDAVSQFLEFLVQLTRSHP